MKAGPTTLKHLIEGEKQYRVPIFQRPYTWTGRELQQLWTDILAQYDSIQETEDGGAQPIRSTHFLGSFVLAPVVGMAHGVTPYLVVDGQQRLITLFLALAALRDLAKEDDEQADAKYNQLYIKNVYASGLDTYKVLPSLADRDQFFACMDHLPGGTSDSKVRAAYDFLLRRIRGGTTPADGESLAPFDLELLKRVIVDRLAVVDITTEPDDNPFRIFSSLNGTGVGLTQADLLRNYVFMMLPTRGEEVYSRVWNPMEVSLGTEENLEGLARVDLQRRGIDATKDEVYQRHQERLEPFAGEEHKIVAEIEDLARQATFYRKLIDPGQESNVAVRASLLRLNRWGAQTTYPLLMQIYGLMADGKTSSEELHMALSYVESFIVRRFLCQVPTKQLNRLFVDLVRTIDGSQPVSVVIRDQLSGQRRYWPTDDQVRSAVRSRPFYLMGRADQRKMFLERVEESYPHKEAVVLARLKLSIEHILPQTLSDNWQQELRDAGEDPDELFSELGHSLGNLTLTAYNGELSNGLFERKKQIYEASNLQLNRELAKVDTWGCQEILDRAEHLAERIIGIWPAPAPGARGVVLGYDWSRIDSAVMAVPEGRWTSYGDLAALGQTHPQPVGAHMSSGGVPNAHRVLDAQGRIAAGFRWPSPDDPRDVRDVLEAEGVIFGSDGVADHSQRLRAYELAQLIPYELDAEEMEDLRLRFERTGSTESKDGSGWLTDGRAWHLSQLKSASGRELLEGIVSLVESSGPGPESSHWEQKYYIAWQTENGYNWAVVHPRQQWIWLNLWNPELRAADLAQKLDYVFVSHDSTLNTSYDGPCQVVDIDGDAGVSIQIRHVGDLSGVKGELLRTVIRETWESHKDSGSERGGRGITRMPGTSLG